MFKKFVVLVLCAFSLYGMEEKDNGHAKIKLAVNKNLRPGSVSSKVEDDILSLYPNFTKEVRIRLIERLSNGSNGAVLSIDFHHMYTPDKSRPSGALTGFHVARTLKAKGFLKNITKQESGCFSAIIKNSSNIKNSSEKFSTFFPDEWSDENIMDCILSVLKPKLQTIKNSKKCKLPGGTRDSEHPNSSCYYGFYSNNKKNFGVKVVADGAKIVSAFPVFIKATR